MMRGSWAVLTSMLHNQSMNGRSRRRKIGRRKERKMQSQSLFTIDSAARMGQQSKKQIVILNWRSRRAGAGVHMIKGKGKLGNDQVGESKQ